MNQRRRRVVSSSVCTDHCRSLASFGEGGEWVPEGPRLTQPSLGERDTATLQEGTSRLRPIALLSLATSRYWGFQQFDTESSEASEGRPIAALLMVSESVLFFKMKPLDVAGSFYISKYYTLGP